MELEGNPPIVVGTSLAALRRTGHLKNASRNVTIVPMLLGSRVGPKK